MIKLISVCVLTLLVAVMAPAAESAHQCGPLASLETQLKTRYNEALIGDGVVVEWGGNKYEPSPTMRLYVNETTGTWTLLFVGPKMACAFGSGDKWQRHVGANY